MVVAGLSYPPGNHPRGNPLLDREAMARNRVVRTTIAAGALVVRRTEFVVMTAAVTDEACRSINARRRDDPR